MRIEFVSRRAWLTDGAYLDLVSAANLIPGPNSTEVAMHVGYRRAGWAGLVVAGASFIAPAFIAVLAFAWAYRRFEYTPYLGWLLYGVQPAIVAVIAHALWAMLVALRGSLISVAIALAVVVGYIAGMHELLLLAGGAALGLVRISSGARRTALVMTPVWLPGSVGMALAPQAGSLFLICLKIGAVLYGSGYVLLAFLRSELVERLGWLTERQLLDAVAVGQFTPGPVFTTATFIGFQLAGWPGAVAATCGIFLPAFVFVALSVPLLSRVRHRPAFRAALDGVNAASLALLAGVSWQLGRAAIRDGFALALAVVALVMLLRWRLNTAWLVLGGALAGLGARASGLA